MNNKIYIVCGPTGSGKTAYAINFAKDIENSLAQKNAPVIINADSVQIYKEIPILSAQPSTEEMQQAEHRLYGYLPMHKHNNVDLWLKTAVPEIKDMLYNNRVPILVGGTGMYIKSLVDGINPVPEIDPELRANIIAMPLADAFALLKEKAPESAEILNEGDTQRIQRALMVVTATGKSLQWWNAQPTNKFFDGYEFVLKFINPPRAKLYDNLDKRFLKMVDMGVIEEAKNVIPMNLNKDNPSFRAHGLRELIAYIKGEMAREDMIAKSQQATRNYAKRQVTWFKHQLNGAEEII